MLKKILCIEDDGYTLEFITNYLETKYPLNVDLAENDIQALQKVKMNNYDLITLDSLDGRCIDFYNKTNRSIRQKTIMLSANDEFRTWAREKQIIFYGKRDEGFDGLEQVLDNIYRTHLS